MPISPNYTAPRHPIVLCHGMLIPPRPVSSFGGKVMVVSWALNSTSLFILFHFSGLFGFDKMGPEAIPHLQIHYWSGIEKALTKLGAKVVVAGVPRFVL